MYLSINPSNAELNPIYHLLALLGTHPILHVSRIKVKYTHIKYSIYLRELSGMSGYSYIVT
jgi:hypothetical protein